MTFEPQVIRLPVADEWPHPPQPDPDWQESVVLAFQDVTRRVGGFIRIGHHPNRATGNCTFGVVSPQQTFTRSRQDVPMRPGDRSAQGFAIDGFLDAHFEDGSSRWRAADDDCELDLEVRDLHPLYDTWALSGLTGGFRENFAASHTEVAGRARGRLRIGAETFDIDGFGYRDHSWGVRRMDDPQSALANFFWLVGAFDEDFVFALVEIVLRTGRRTKMGYILKDGGNDIPRVTDLTFLTELDGICTRGARCRFDTGASGSFVFEVEGFGNVLLGMEARYLESGMPGLVRWGDRVGGAHLSTMFNARDGRAAPPLLFDASAGNGLHQRQAFAAAGF